MVPTITTHEDHAQAFEAAYQHLASRQKRGNPATDDYITFVAARFGLNAAELIAVFRRLDAGGK